MSILRDFALENIYCSPSEDKQFRYQLVRATKPKYPIRSKVTLYNFETYDLPDNKNLYHVYLIGGVAPSLLNFLTSHTCCKCNRTEWINVEEDMNSRPFLFQMYDDKGLDLPRSHIYYMITPRNNVVIAVKVDNDILKYFNIDDYKYIRVYSNPYYKDELSDDLITIKSSVPVNRTQMVEIQRQITALDKRGNTLIYVNGWFVSHLDLEDHVGQYVEYMHDTGIKKMERHPIGDMRTFMSLMDKRMKLFLYRDRVAEYIESWDDVEIYICFKDGKGKDIGLYYYQNRHLALNNVTDKDYSLDSGYVNYHVQILNSIANVGIDDCEVILYSRSPMYRRNLVYSSLKLQELYKLPYPLQLQTMDGSGPSIEPFRVEYLEDSDHWKLASMVKLCDITDELSCKVIGYSAATFYFGNTPNLYYSNNVYVPFLYQEYGTAYVYDENGVLVEVDITNGPYFNTKAPSVSQIEYVQGRPVEVNRLYEFEDVVKVNLKTEFVVLSALYDFKDRLEEYREAELGVEYIIEGDQITFIEESFRRYRIIYINEYQEERFKMNLDYFFPMFEFKVILDQGEGLYSDGLDYYPRNLEIFFNGHRLIEGLDFFMDFPKIQICNKSYIDYTIDEQEVIMRALGVVLTKDEINNNEVKGYVNNGVLMRNKHYDIRDDRVFSTWIDGKLVERSRLRFADDDNTVRIDDVINGLPYVVSDKLINITPVSDLPTLPYYEQSISLNKQIEGLYDVIYPEPEIDPFNVIRDHHYLFSPLVSRMLRDCLSGIIPTEIYSRRYQAWMIRELIDEKYSELELLDPINKGLPTELVEIMPDYGNEQIIVDVHLYRFMWNLVDLLTEGNPSRVNLSNYLLVDRGPDTVVDVGNDSQEIGGLTPYD